MGYGRSVTIYTVPIWNEGVLSAPESFDEFSGLVALKSESGEPLPSSVRARFGSPKLEAMLKKGGWTLHEAYVMSLALPEDVQVARIVRDEDGAIRIASDALSIQLNESERPSAVDSFCRAYGLRKLSTLGFAKNLFTAGVSASQNVFVVLASMARQPRIQFAEIIWLEPIEQRGGR